MVLKNQRCQPIPSKYPDRYRRCHHRHLKRLGRCRQLQTHENLRLNLRKRLHHSNEKPRNHQNPPPGIQRPALLLGHNVVRKDTKQREEDSGEHAGETHEHLGLAQFEGFVDYEAADDQAQLADRVDLGRPLFAEPHALRTFKLVLVFY